MTPEALILRRCYPVPVTFADLRAAHVLLPSHDVMNEIWRKGGRVVGGSACLPAICWHAALKEATGAIDEVYAVVDGREVRVAIAGPHGAALCGAWSDIRKVEFRLCDLLDAADRAGYWERPHEVRIELQERTLTHDEVARAVMVGQECMERGGVVRS